MKFRHLLSSAACVLPLAIAFPASAQDAASADVGGLQEIVVTAQKRSENLQRVPIAVTAIGAGDLLDANIDGQQDLPKLTPGLNLTALSATVSPYIRGIGSQFANAGLEGSVSVYLDDTYLPRATSALFSLTDLERIEVLKGPQGTLYGRNATGGAIRIITRDPTDVFEGSASVTYGSQNRLAADAVLNLSLAEGAALRLTASHDENDGYVRNRAATGPRRLESRNEELYRAKLLLKPTDRLTIKLSGDYLDKGDTDSMSRANLFGAPESVGAGRGGLVSTDFYNLAMDYPDTQLNIRSWGLAGRIEYDLDRLSLVSITSYRDQKQVSATDLDSSSLPIQNASQLLRTKMFSQEFQLISDFDGPIDFVGGLYIYDEKSRQLFGIFGTSVGAGVYRGGDGEVHTKSFAPYVQADYHVSDTLTLTAGARYTWESKRLLYNNGILGTAPQPGELFPTNVILNPNGDCTAPGQVLCNPGQPRVKFEKFTPKLTISYQPFDKMLFYATYSRGFKSGGFNLPSFGFVDSLNPETLDSFELGWKLQNGDIRFNGAAFHYSVKDLQQQITNIETGGTRAVNAASAKVWGIEGDLAWAAASGLELGGGFSYLHAEYDRYIGDAFVPCALAPADAGCIARGGLGLGTLAGQDFGGQRLVNTPRFSGYVRGSYEMPLGDGLGTIRLSTIVSYQGRTHYDPAGRFYEPSRPLVSGRIGWTSENEKFSLTVFGDNLTDEKYALSRNPTGLGGARNVGAPRQVYIQAGVRF